MTVGSDFIGWNPLFVFLTLVKWNEVRGLIVFL